MTPTRRLNETAEKTPVPRRVFGVFATITVASVVGMVALFAVLYREADHGHLTIPAAVALLVGSYLVTSLAGMAAFIKLALPPVAEQTQRLERALDVQVEVNRRQHDFLTHVHHELRTPATIVLGATQLLMARGEEMPTDQRSQLREAAYRNAEALTQLVEDLTRGVDQALPGMTFDGHVDNWSSTKARRLTEVRRHDRRSPP